MCLAIKAELEESKTEEPRDQVTAVISHTIPEDADEDTKDGYINFIFHKRRF